MANSRVKLPSYEYSIVNRVQFPSPPSLWPSFTKKQQSEAKNKKVLHAQSSLGLIPSTGKHYCAPNNVSARTAKSPPPLLPHPYLYSPLIIYIDKTTFAFALVHCALSPRTSANVTFTLHFPPLFRFNWAVSGLNAGICEEITSHGGSQSLTCLCICRF